MLVDYLLGESSETERLLVKNWIGQSAENKSYFDQFTLAWNASKQMASSAANEDAAWQRLQSRLKDESVAPKAIPLHSAPKRFLRVAAIALLLISTGVMAYIISSKNDQPVMADQVEEASPAVPVQREQLPLPPPVKKQEVAVVPKATPPAPAPKPEIREPKKLTPQSIAARPVKKEPTRYELAKLADDCKTKGEICNGTPCPLQICIIQKSTCDKDHPYPISNCSILEPDKTGQLYYKGFDEQTYTNCSLLVSEIKITRLTTGETITLNDHSAVTAQEFFNYITGKKQGEITAGIFTADCNSNYIEHGLSMDNTYGGVHFR